jgi:Ran GTPase-activating protein (RanGAP) involved in mRNA processing and transport
MSDNSDADNEGAGYQETLVHDGEGDKSISDSAEDKGGNVEASKSNLDSLGVAEEMFDYYSDGDEILSVEEDTEKPKTNSRNFEFSSSINMMRVTRLIICLQILGLAIDSPLIQLPIVFRIICRGILFYSTKFYSRPFIDIVYFFQWFNKEWLSKLPSTPGNIVFETPSAPDVETPSTPSGTRKLLEETIYNGMRFLRSASDYVESDPIEPVLESKVDFLDSRLWHSTKYFSHFFLSALSVAMFAFFTIRFWEIKDYTDRKEVREWLRINIADGWWRRGLAVFTWSLAKGCLFLGIFGILLFGTARQFTANAMPTAPMVGGALAIFGAILLLYYILGYIGMHASESVFIRYVSQNVSYTSQIILKRVVKVKIDIGIMVMFAVYMPALRVFAEGFFVIIDWNDTLSYDYRRSVNYYTPCYLKAFPPYTKPNVDPGYCSLHYSISPKQPPRAEGYYSDNQIASCDSYLGVSLFTTAMGFFCFTLIGYAWLYWELIDCCVKELSTSRWVSTLHTLISIRKELNNHYNEKFSAIERLTLDSIEEGTHQLSYIFQAIKWIALTIVSSTTFALKFLFYPIYYLFSPCLFVGSSIFFLIFPCLQNDDDEAPLSDAQIERNRIKKEEEFLKNMGDSMSYQESMSLLAELSVQESIDEEEAKKFTFKERLKSCLWYIEEKINVVKLLYNKTISRIAEAKLNWKRNPTVNEMKMKLSEFKMWLLCDKTTSMGLHKMGGTQGDWRLQQTITARLKKIRRIDTRITEELRSVRDDFTSDHALAITVFDRVIDTSGLFMLISQYHFHRLYWTMVLWVEMTLYSLISTYANYFMDWKPRLMLLMQVNIFFGVFTYICKPFTEDTDRWLDFLGRILVSGTLYGIVYINDNQPTGGMYNDVPAAMYEPWKSFDFLKNLDITGSGMHMMADVCITFYLFAYLLNVINIAGFFSIIERYFRSSLYGMHDHIMNYLITNLEKRTIGRENMFEGLLLVQQWDDIIKEQRRYALIPWPDVRPADLLPMSMKLIEIKWASFFNLTLKNMRSSLGLTILHTSMCNADSEVARWLICNYPDLLNVEDFQKDTPIFVALKECSYFLLKYGEQNEGLLNDGTGYNDEIFLSVYPEIEQLRNEALEEGEYMKALGDELHLDAFELRNLNRDFYFIETKDIPELREYRPSFIDFKSKLSKYATQAEIDAEKAEKAAWDSLNATTEVKLTPEEEKAIARQEAKIAALEKASLYRKRFPEDDFQDDYESGQLASWGIIGLSVPDSNLFVDPYTKSFNDYAPKNDPFYDPNAEQNDEDYYYDVEKALDVRYNVKSLRFPTIPDKFANLVPNGHPAIKEMLDWDIMAKKKRVEARSLLSTMHEAKQAVEAAAGWMLGRVTLAQWQEKEREVRFKMCKFAEILLSDEIQACCQLFDWNVNSYKELNKIASREQGRIAQNLAMSCNMNPPAGFTRISEWTMGVSTNVFDEFPYEEFHAAVNVAVKIAGGAATVHEHVNRIIPKVRRGARRPHEILLQHSNKRAGDHPDQEDGFNDRIIHYLAECYCACRTRLDFEDLELSVCGRNGWRAISRALRRKNCTFIVPSIFVGTRQILTTHLNLARNELDDGDAVLLSDILLYKQTMVTLNLEHNRIGARGLIRILKALKGHENIKILYLGHNRIGPAAGRELGIWLKACNTIELLDLSHNRLGELIQYPTSICRERVQSAARDIFQGMRKNKSLQTLDLSYNHLGPILADVVPIAIMKHPNLTIFDISGNDLGPSRGANLVFALGLQPGGDHEIEEREKYYRDLKEKQLQGIDVVAEAAAAAQEEAEKQAARDAKNLLLGKEIKKKSNKKSKKKLSDDSTSKLAYIGLRDNQLGKMAGHGLAAMVVNSKAVTSIDVSGNNIGLEGGEALADGLEKVYGLVPRDFFKKSLYDLEQKKYEGRDAIVRKIIYTNLTNLNLSQNGIGPLGCQGIMYCMAQSNCTITSLDLSSNPLGETSEIGGKGQNSGKDMRYAIGETQSLTDLNLSRTSFLPVDMVPLLGAVNRNRSLKRLIINNTYLDEPSCLQLAHGVSTCPSITVLDLHNNRMGPKGGLIIVSRLDTLGKRLTFLDVSDNGIGPIASIPIGRALIETECTLKTMYVQGNDIMDEGGRYIVKGMKENASLTDVNLSNNRLTGDVAEIIADVARGLYIDGKKISDCQLKRLSVSDNPAIGKTGAKLIMKAMTSSNFTHVEMANVGGGPGVGKIIGDHIRDVALKWIYCDISGNALSRPGLNEIFWGMRQNRSLRIFKCGDNQAGSIFGSDSDALLGHGIALQRTITANVIIRELDVSYNSLSSNAMTNLFEGMVENYTIRKLCLRGNFMDDEAAVSLLNFLKYNNTVDDLDLGENKLGFDCCYSLAEGIGLNRSLKNLALDDNNLNAAGTAPLAAFVAGLQMNISMRMLIMDGNKLGSEWGVQISSALARNNTLVQFSFRDNRLDERAGKCLLKAFTHAPFLLELALSKDEVGDEIWDDFRRVFMKKRSVIDTTYLAYETRLNETNTKILEKYYFEDRMDIR